MRRPQPVVMEARLPKSLLLSLGWADRRADRCGQRPGWWPASELRCR